MNVNNPILQQLKDIETPIQIGLWPLAWGWWLLIALTTLSVGWLIWFIFANWRFKKALREAKNILNNVNIDDKTAHHINTTLKRLALHYGNREQVAPLTDQGWLHWLNAQQDKVTFHIEELNYLYTNERSPDADLLAYKNKALAWMNAINVKKLSNKENADV